MTRPLSTVLGSVALLLALSACATPTTGSEPPSTAGDPNATHPAACDAKSLSWTMGQVADDALIERARVEAGATTVRVLRPGMLVTNEFNAMRLNLRIDNDRRVLSYSCG